MTFYLLARARYRCSRGSLEGGTLIIVRDRTPRFGGHGGGGTPGPIPNPEVKPSSVIECGVCFGGGLMAWAHFASILEPVHHARRVIGFDTFAGFPGMSAADDGAESGLAYAGGMATPLDGEIARLAELHDTNRPLGHIPRVELVKCDACEKIPAYVQANPHLVVALLVLDFDIHAPTAAALKAFLPLMPKGAVVVFDELNCRDWPGETQAALPDPADAASAVPVVLDAILRGARMKALALLGVTILLGFASIGISTTLWLLLLAVLAIVILGLGFHQWAAFLDWVMEK